MGGLIIETVRPGVQFTPDAAAAFRRADAQVLAEFGRRIDVNSTYRSWSDQMVMYIDWSRYVASGYRPSLKPNHSKAVHPSQSFHVSGTALDSDDWVKARIVEILAANGFIRNRLHVPNERHHFEYIRTRDKNYGRPAGGATTTPKPAPEPEPELPPEEDDMPTVIKNPATKEWCLLDPKVGLDLPQFFAGQKNAFRSEKTANGVVNTYRGFIVTTDPGIGDAWSRTHCRFYKNVPQERLGDDFRTAQNEGSRLSIETHRA